SRGYKLPDDLRIKGVSGYADARIPQKISWPSASLPDRRPDMDQGKITGAAAEISNQNQFIMIKSGFVIVGCCYRLQLKFYKLETGRAKCQFEPIFGKSVVNLGFGSHKPDRAPNYSRVDCPPKLALGFFPQVAKNPCNQVFQCDPPSEDLSTLEV